MSALPFLVVHGPWVWALLLAAGAALTVAWWHRRRGRALRRAATVEREALGVPDTEPEEGRRTVLLGTLRGGEGEAARTVIGPRPNVAEVVQHTEHADSIVLESDSLGAVAIPGEVLVAAGSLEIAGPGRADAKVLAFGDRVVVRGSLRKRAVESGEYRASAAHWELADEGPVALAAAEPPRTRLPFRTVLGASVLGGLATLAVLAAAGDALLSRPLVDGGVTVSAQLACAFGPWSREESLRRLVYALGSEVEDDAAQDDAYVAMFELTDQPIGRAVSTLARAGRPEKAEALLEEARDTNAQRGAWDVAQAYAERFDHAAASRVLQTYAGRAAREDLMTHLLAGQLEPARAVAHAMDGQRPGSECLALYLDALAGDDAAQTTLAERAEPLCRLLHADRLTGTERLGALGEELGASRGMRYPYDRLAVYLRAEACHDVGPPCRVGGFVASAPSSPLSGSTFSGSTWSYAAVPGRAARVAEALANTNDPELARVRVDALFELAVFRALVDDLDGAEAHLAEARRALATLRPWVEGEAGAVGGEEPNEGEPLERRPWPERIEAREARLDGLGLVLRGLRGDPVGAREEAEARGLQEVERYLALEDPSVDMATLRPLVMPLGRGAERATTSLELVALAARGEAPPGRDLPALRVHHLSLLSPHSVVQENWLALRARRALGAPTENAVRGLRRYGEALMDPELVVAILVASN